MRSHKYILILFLLIYISFIFNACKKDTPTDKIPPATTPYPIPSIPNFRAMPTNANNPMTVEGVALGKKLFFDPILSKDSSISCSSCHSPANSFSDARFRSIGVDGLPGKRHSMALVN